MIMRIAGIMLLSSTFVAAAHEFDLRSPAATGGTYVLSSDQARRNYALWAARAAYPDSSLAKRTVIADKLQACIGAGTGVNAERDPPGAIEKRRSPLSQLTLDCIGELEDDRHFTSAESVGDFGYGATGEQYMKASRKRQLEHVVGVASLHDLDAPRARTIALASYLDDCLKQAMTPSRRVTREAAARVRSEKLGLITETCLVLWERR